MMHQLDMYKHPFLPLENGLLSLKPNQHALWFALVPCCPASKDDYTIHGDTTGLLAVTAGSESLHASTLGNVNRLSNVCLILQESGVRRGKVLAAADQYAQLINGAIETIVEQSFSSKHLAKRTDSSSQPAVRHVPLPPSIIANTEPFRHGDWRKEPYPTRSATSLCCQQPL